MSEEVTQEEGLVYGWSAHSDEGFVGAFPSQAEALADAYEYVGKSEDIYVQAGRYEEVTKLAPDHRALAENVTDILSENAFEDCGELAEDWPDASDEAKEELATDLQTVIHAWMKKHLKMPAWEPVGEPVMFPAPEPVLSLIHI